MCFRIFVQVLCAAVIFAHNHPKKYEKYGKYGEDWILFPDGNEKLTFGILKSSISRDFIFYDVPSSVTFRLYTRSSPLEGKIIFPNTSLELETSYNVEHPTKIIVHGWLSSGSSDTCVSIKDSYLNKYDYNVIIVDWSPIASNIFYPIPMEYTHEVATYYAELVDHLITSGTKSEDIHLIGHSLGAHISGYVGDKIKNERIGRVTGLDPAFPGFATQYRLSKSSAIFVDIIHSCSGFLGIPFPIGTADFYPNGGFPPQPGCYGVIEVVQACSHGKSWKIFNESISQHFYAKRCTDWQNINNKLCKGETVLMGDQVDTQATGVYYTQTP